MLQGPPLRPRAVYPDVYPGAFGPEGREAKLL